MCNAHVKNSTWQNGKHFAPFQIKVANLDCIRAALRMCDLLMIYLKFCYFFQFLFSFFFPVFMSGIFYIKSWLRMTTQDNAEHDNKKVKIEFIWELA